MWHSTCLPQVPWLVSWLPCRPQDLPFKHPQNVYPTHPQKLGPHAPDKWEAYGAELVQQAVQAAQAEGFPLQGKPEGERCPVQQPGRGNLYQLLYRRSH